MPASGSTLALMTVWADYHWDLGGWTCHVVPIDRPALGWPLGPCGSPREIFDAAMRFVDELAEDSSIMTFHTLDGDAAAWMEVAESAGVSLT